MDIDKVYKRIVANLKRYETIGDNLHNAPYMKDGSIYVTRAGGKFNAIPEAFYPTLTIDESIAYITAFAQNLSIKYGEQVTAKILARWAKDPCAIEKTFEDIVANNAVNDGSDLLALAGNREFLYRASVKDGIKEGYHTEEFQTAHNNDTFTGYVADEITPKITTPEMYGAFKTSRDPYGCIIPKFTESGAIQAVIAKGGYLKIPTQYVSLADCNQWVDSLRSVAESTYKDSKISSRDAIIEAIVKNHQVAQGRLSQPYSTLNSYPEQKNRADLIADINAMRRALFTLYDFEILAPTTKIAKAVCGAAPLATDDDVISPLTKPIARSIVVRGEVYVNQDEVNGETVTEITPVNETKGLDYTVESCEVLDLDSMGGQE